MPYWRECFEEFGQVKSFTAGDLALHNGVSKNASLDNYLSSVEYLLVRSTTKINAELVEKMPNLQFVGTATAGYDHIDTACLSQRGIPWYAAGGCNAQAVAQYVLCAALHLAETDKFLIASKKICIVGNGNVGSRVAASFTALGASVCVYDPPQRSLIGELPNTTYVELEEAMQADIICLHAPFNSIPEYPSKHLFNAERLKTLKSNQYLINAGRGELIDNRALLQECCNRPAENLFQLVLDVWENEPTINRELIPFLRIASPHIAGHSLEGKARGTFMLHEQLCKLKGVAQFKWLEQYLPKPEHSIPSVYLDELTSLKENDGTSLQACLKKICDFSYDILNDDRVFRAHMAQSRSFAILRQEYPIRREFSALPINASTTKINDLLRKLGFIISNDSDITP